MTSFTTLRRDAVFCEYRGLGIDYSIFGYDAIAEIPSAITALIFSFCGIWMLHTWHIHQHYIMLKMAVYLCFVGFGSFMYHLTFWDGFAHCDIIPMILLVGKGVTHSLYDLSYTIPIEPTTYKSGITIVISETFIVTMLIMSIYTELYEYLFTIALFSLVATNVYSYIQFITWIDFTPETIDNLGVIERVVNMHIYKWELNRLYKISWVCLFLAGFSKYMDEIYCEYDSRVSYMQFHSLWHFSIAFFTISYAAIYQCKLSTNLDENFKLQLIAGLIPKVSTYSKLKYE
jgi:hypothetical protein